MIMTARVAVRLDPDVRRRAHARAALLGISFAEYVRRLVRNDLGDQQPARQANRPDISCMFDLVQDGPPTNIARDKHKMIGEAVWNEYLRKTGHLPKKARRSRKGA
jgi:hypothetical protein